MRPLGSTIQLQPGSFRRAARAARTCPAIRHSAASRRAARRISCSCSTLLALAAGAWAFVLVARLTGETDDG